MNFKTLALLFGAFIAFSFTNQTNDGCKPYFPMTKGTTWEYKEYDKKGELSGTNTTEVIEINSSGDRIEYKIKGVTDGPKKKEKNHHEMEFSYICENGVFKMSMEGMIPKETMESFGETATVEMEQSELEFPSSLSEGDELKDASIKVKVNMGAMTVMNMNILIYDRKIEKIEEVTTEAGTYNCAILSQKSTTKMGFSTIESSSKDWWSAEVGVVKSEYFNKKGEPSGSRELISYKAG